MDFVSESLLIILKKRDFTSVFFTVRKERQEKVDENSLLRHGTFGEGVL